MKKFLRRVGIALMILAVLFMVAPFLIPVAPLENTLPAEALTDADSLFVDVNGLTVHYKTYGEGAKTFILLHGFGASIFSWREVSGPLSQYGRVIAYDRPAFGLTERPMEWQGVNPYSQEAQADLVIGLMDALGVEKATLIGNSAGGTISMLAYLRYPERIESLVLVDPAVYAGGGAPAWIRPLLGTPQFDHIGPLFARQLQVRGTEFLKTAWHNPDKITAEIVEGYQEPLRVNDWDKALWYLTLSSQESGLAERISEFILPILVITGDDDRIVPTEQSQHLADELPSAQLAVIPQCGHVPHEECPAAFMQAVEDFLGSLP